MVLTERDRRLLADRRWPGTRAANVDMLLIGPGGVFVIDVKNWRAAPEVVKGRLWAGGWAWDGHVGKLLDVTKSAERAVGSHGLSPVAVQPLMAFAGRRLDARLGSIRLLGEREVREIADRLEQVFPGYEESTVGETAKGSPRGQVEGAKGFSTSTGCAMPSSTRRTAPRSSGG
ncbi:hypothetical protein GCM10010357_03840 [Streptomyces luteireticuli]|uniref:NERD domain-containing protein n=1 Tax=Streptomyces luteireticuli TaxID=173858 RepID=A0ABP3I0B2_9ACTN